MVDFEGFSPLNEYSSCVDAEKENASSSSPELGFEQSETIEGALSRSFSSRASFVPLLDTFTVEPPFFNESPTASACYYYDRPAWGQVVRTRM